MLRWLGPFVVCDLSMNMVLNQALDKPSLVHGPCRKNDVYLASVLTEFAFGEPRSFHVARHQGQMAPLEAESASMFLRLSMTGLKRKPSPLQR